MLEVNGAGPQDEILMIITTDVCIGGRDVGPHHSTCIAHVPYRLACELENKGRAYPAPWGTTKPRDGLDASKVVPVTVNAGQVVEFGGRTYLAGERADVPLTVADGLFLQARAVPAAVVVPDWSRVPAGPHYCGPHTRRCSDARDYSQDRRPCCREIIRELLRFVGAHFDALGVTWWADYGTLLGAVRHGGMVPHDKDGDLGILAEDEEVVRLLQHVVAKAGMGWRVSGKGAMKFRCSLSNRTNVDVFAWRDLGDGVLRRRRYARVDRYKGREFARELLFPLTTVEYEGLTLPAPRDPEAFLEHRYGAGWRTPIRANNDGVVR